MADVIIMDEDDVPRPSPRRVPVSTKTHITQSPFVSSINKQHVLQAENDKLFSEFVEHVVTETEDCPQVLEYLKSNYAKARSDYLSSVEFRNSLGRCLTRLEANRSRAFVYIYELCMVLKQHKDRSKKNTANPSTSTSACLAATSSKSESKTKSAPEHGGNPSTEDDKPSTSGFQEIQQKAEKRASRASRKQIAYLENMLKIYDNEICRLQRTELSLDDLDAEDSMYIQEHKLKRKMMKIYNKLCELKECSPLTGRILERKILYNDPKYPEISKRVQRYINKPDVCMNPPDYQDILQQVQLANKRHNLHLSGKELERIARKAFTETGSQIQQRRHHDLLYDFGCQLTSEYKPDNDPALKDSTLHRRLRDNHELGLNRLEDVINKYSVLQDNTDKKDREQNGEEEEEEDEDEEDVSSEADIEEEIQASSQQGGPDDDDEDDGNEAEKMSDHANEDGLPTENVTVAAAPNDNEAVTSGLHSDASMPGFSPLSDDVSASNSPRQSEPTQPDDGAASSEDPPHLASQATSKHSIGTDPPAATNGASLRPPLEMTCHSPITNGTSPPVAFTPDRRLSRSRKRKMLDTTPKRNHIDANDREAEIPLDMGVICASPAQTIEASDCQLVTSSQSPSPKKIKVSVATQCDPLEIIELSDSE